MRVSILVPVYNEAATVGTLLDRLLSIDLGFDAEVIVVDDASTDRTPAVLERYRGRVLLHRHSRNRGKGAAIRTALESATGDYVVPQDADLEYDPADLALLASAARQERRPIVYGSRRLRPENRRHSHLSFYLGGRLVTWIANRLYGLRLTDEPTCYKLIDRRAIAAMDLECERFEFCAEVTAKAARMGLPIHEVPIRYAPRRMGEGKKIRAIDGWATIRTLLRYRSWQPPKQAAATPDRG